MTETVRRQETRETRERVLDAAGELFAERGFRDTTIREIKDRAGANIAAVNYYFRDKESLHEEVIRRAFQYSREHVLEPTFAREGPPEDRLRFFIHRLLEAMVGAGRPAWHTQLVMRELCDPTPAFRRVTREFGRPNFSRLEEVVAAVAGPGTDADQIRFVVLSIFGQCTYYRSAKPVILELARLEEYTPEFIASTAERIAEFTLAALSGMRGKPGR
jgi:AcrR family transcriptional regulator